MLALFKIIKSIDFMGFLENACILATVILGIYCYVLGNENDRLQAKIDEIIPVAQAQSKLLLECDANTKELKEQSEKKTADAQKAVAEAKKDTQVLQDRITELKNRKPQVVVVTKENEKDYGGSDIMIQLKDYLATHQLANEEIDRRAAK